MRSRISSSSVRVIAMLGLNDREFGFGAVVSALASGASSGNSCAWGPTRRTRRTISPRLPVDRGLRDLRFSGLGVVLKPGPGIPQRSARSAANSAGGST